MANISDFKESNMVWKGWPASDGRVEVLDMPAYRDKTQSISCWKLTFWERVRALFTGRIWLYVLGDGQPPVYVTGEYPFKRLIKEEAVHG